MEGEIKRQQHEHNYYYSLENVLWLFVSGRRQSPAAVVDGSYPVELNGEQHARTIRTSCCQLLSNSTKCQSCVSHRSTLRATYHRWHKQQDKLGTPSSSHVNDRFLQSPQKTAKIKRHRARLTSAQQHGERVKDGITSIILEHGVTVGPSLHEDHAEIRNKNQERSVKSVRRSPSEGYSGNINSLVVICLINRKCNAERTGKLLRFPSR